MKKWSVTAALVFLILAGSLHAQRAERDAKKVAESEQVQSVSGGTTFQLSGPYDVVFDTLVNYLKRNDLTLESASRDAGQIATAMEITGGWKQTGKHTVISILKDSPGQTSVRVTITVQKRYKGLQTEPWGDAKVDDKASAAYAAKIQPDLVAALIAAKN
jgi:uncharacterized lipoprotein